MQKQKSISSTQTATLEEVYTGKNGEFNFGLFIDHDYGDAFATLLVSDEIQHKGRYEYSYDEEEKAYSFSPEGSSKKIAVSVTNNDLPERVREVMVNDLKHFV